MGWAQDSLPCSYEFLCLSSKPSIVFDKSRAMLGFFFCVFVIKFTNMKYFSATYGDYKKFDAKPNEDYYLISKKLPVLAVADGVTQSHHKNGRYALPYGAKGAARVFCKNAIQYLEKSLDFRKVNGKEIKSAIKNTFNFANQKIKELNIKHGIDKKMDYITYDWFDSVGALGIIIKNKLYCGYVGDCGLIIFDKNNKKVFQTKDMVKPAVKRFEKTHKNWKTLPQSKRTLIVHRDFRNNPNKMGYGSFSGEPNVEKYYQIKSKKLESNDLAVFYSDGFFELLKNKEFVKILRSHNKKSLPVL